MQVNVKSMFIVIVGGRGQLWYTGKFELRDHESYLNSLTNRLNHISILQGTDCWQWSSW